MVALVESLGRQLYRSYQMLQDPTRLEYAFRIRQESKLLFTTDKAIKLLEDIQEQPDEKIAKLSLAKLSFVYYKTDAQNELISKKIANNDALKTSTYLLPQPSRPFVNALVANIEYYGTIRQKIKAYLFQIYHFAIHNNYKAAKELLLKTHMQEIIHGQEINVQVLYNRAVTQIGLAAFRLGLIEETQESLADIAQNQRIKEVLAQSYNKIQERTSEQEKDEIKRKIPFHMQINTSLIDSAYHITAMLVEIPQGNSSSGRLSSRPFKKLIELYDTKSFHISQPDQYRDAIVLAARELSRANWKKAL